MFISHNECCLFVTIRLTFNTHVCISTILRSLDVTTKTHTTNARDRALYASAHSKLKHSNRKVLLSARAQIVKGLKIVETYTIHTTDCNPNYRNSTHEHYQNVLQRFVYKMNHSCLHVCVCFVTMRLLLNVSHVILQLFIITA